MCGKKSDVVGRNETKWDVFGCSRMKAKKV